MEVLWLGLYALIGSVLVSLGLSIRTAVTSYDAASKRKNEQALFDSNLRNRELEQKLAIQDALTKAATEIAAQSNIQRDLIDAANSKVASSETAIDLLQRAEIENRRINAERDRLSGEQKAKISMLEATVATMTLDKAALTMINDQLELANKQLTRILNEQAEVKAGGSTPLTRAKNAANERADAEAAGGDPATVDARLKDTTKVVIDQDRDKQMMQAELDLLREREAGISKPTPDAINEAVDVLAAAKPLTGTPGTS